MSVKAVLIFRETAFKSASANFNSYCSSGFNVAFARNGIEDMFRSFQIWATLFEAEWAAMTLCDVRACVCVMAEEACEPAWAVYTPKQAD